jgi:hypothetical protein
MLRCYPIIANGMLSRRLAPACFESEPLSFSPWISLSLNKIEALSLYDVDRKKVDLPADQLKGGFEESFAAKSLLKRFGTTDHRTARRYRTTGSSPMGAIFGHMFQL